MKKGFKIATTVASLCLAVALLAFGVYAATSSTLSINSTVSFTSQDVQVIWEWSVEGGSLTTATSGEYETTVEGAVDDKDVNLGTVNFVTNAGEAGKTITFTVELKMADSATEVEATPVNASFDANHDIA